MRRKYERKGTKADHIEKELGRLLTEEADAEGQYSKRQTQPILPEDFASSFIRLRDWLQASENDAGVTSALIQVWLWQQGIRWPTGVFVTDLNSTGSGRKPTLAETVGFEAAVRYIPGKIGYGSLARMLIKDEWMKDPRAAATKIQDLITAYYTSQRDTHLGRIAENVANEMLGIERDDEATEPFDIVKHGNGVFYVAEEFDDVIVEESNEGIAENVVSLDDVTRPKL